MDREQRHQVGNHLFITSFVINSSAILLSVVSIICLGMMKKMHGAFRVSSLSFSVANLVSTSVLLYHTTVINNVHEEHTTLLLLSELNCSLMILTLLHLFCLVLVEYIIVSSRWKKTEKNFTGLLIISWVMTACVCGIIISAKRKIIKVITAGVLLLAFIAVLLIYTVFIQKHRYRKRKVLMFKSRNIKGGLKYSETNLIFSRLILASFFLFALPWTCYQLYISMTDESIEFSVEFALLAVYSLHFHFMSILCIFMWARKR